MATAPASRARACRRLAAPQQQLLLLQPLRPLLLGQPSRHHWQMEPCRRQRHRPQAWSQQSRRRLTAVPPPLLLPRHWHSQPTPQHAWRLPSLRSSPPPSTPCWLCLLPAAALLLLLLLLLSSSRLAAAC
jgi:hypothetical protein